jgi:hypothetical protein
MAARDISEEAVDQVLTHHHTILPRRNGGHELIGEVEGRRLKVVVDDRWEPHQVITAFWMDDSEGSSNANQG